ncbi:flagellar protein FlgN [bacterium]|nr:flagellar protein FlgN [bacterium]
MKDKQTLTQQILQILQKQIGFHRQLLETIRMEKEALVNADLSGIQEATYAKEALVEGIKQQEAERIKTSTELALVFKKPLRELTLTGIILEVQGWDLKMADTLRSAQNTLALLAQRISDQNKYNKDLVEKSLGHVQEMKKNVLGESTPRSDTYSQSGQKVNATPSSRLISKEA